MAVNKVIYDGTTLVDLTADTVTADNLASGVTATAANGEKITGLLPKVTIDTALSETSTNPVTNAAITTAVNAKADTSSLSAVATSGAYSDLSGVPTIPEAYTLPTASSSTLGGVKIGNLLSVSKDGTLSVNLYNGFTVGAGRYIQWLNNTQYVGSISESQYSGNAATATKATQDASGNVITDTYATKTELSAKAPTASPIFTGTVTAETVTVTSALNIPGGKIWIA